MWESTWTVSDAIEELEIDPWREAHPFSTELLHCHEVLFDPSRTRKEKLASMTAWLAEFQPCLFGRMEAKQNRLAFCLLTENDLARSDQYIQGRIEEDRLDWKRQAFHGQSHAFLILAVSEKIAKAQPGEALLGLAKRICKIYLGIADTDKVLHDDLILDIHGVSSVERRIWKVGVNFFSAQGDGRWWHDHRIPGGIAFSMNSVGHMARSLVEKAMQKDPKLAERCATESREKLVYWALPKAMKTIGPHQENGIRGTWLVDRGSFPEDKEPPTYEVRERYFGDLARYSENRYQGLYHTDETIPSPYFDASVTGQDSAKVRDDMFFTYIHSLTDEDYQSMGLGIAVTGQEENRDQNRSEL